MKQSENGCPNLVNDIQIVFVEIVQHHQTNDLVSGKLVCPAVQRMDAVVLPICGKKYWLWRAVDSDGEVLDILVQ